MSRQDKTFAQHSVMFNEYYNILPVIEIITIGQTCENSFQNDVFQAMFLQFWENYAKAMF